MGTPANTPLTTPIPSQILALQSQVQLNTTISTSVFSLIGGLILILEQAVTDLTGVQTQTLITTLQQSQQALADACVKAS